MANILTPISLWNNFDVSLDLSAEILSAKEINDVVIQSVTFFGRETEKGRIKIAAAYAYNEQAPSSEAVLIFPDSTQTVNDDIMTFFVKRGYSVLMVDYRGEWEDCDFYTQYPEDVSYANVTKCGRRKDFVDDSADKTSWYEWVGVGLYASKYLSERIGSDKIAAVGIRDGGEIVWKLGVAGSFKCIIPICAAGWKAYNGISKFRTEEPALDEERYRFIAGIDSQAYAPYVKCPVLMLCSTGDPEFDYDRAFDTFSRINPEFVSDSSIAYTMKCAGIGEKSTADLFLLLDKTLKNRQVFIPAPPVINVEVDEDSNLIARVKFDTHGIVENCKLYLAEDCLDSAMREWSACTEKGRTESDFLYYLNIYEKTTTLFALSRVKYINGFTVWSKMAVKKLGGRFRNMQGKRRVMYNDKDGSHCFSALNYKKGGIGGIFFINDSVLPHLVTKAKGVKGLYSEFGLSTLRMGSPQYAPSPNNVLSADLYCDENADFVITLINVATGEEYSEVLSLVGGVWQTVIMDAKSFKTSNGTALSAFGGDLKFTLNCSVPYAINNLMWL